MEFHQLEYLVTIAEEKTILKASEKLGISQPALTRSIKNLEEEFGFPLFDRIKNRLYLNEMGELAVRYAKEILNNREKMVASLTNLNESKTQIRIGSSAPAPLWGALHILQTKYAKSNLTGILNEDSAFLLEQFEDKAFRFLLLDYPVHQKNVISKVFLKEQLYLAVKKEHEWATRKSITFAELNGTTVMSVSNTGYWAELCQENMPDSLLLIQNDLVAYRALMEASNLPVFRSNLTIPRFQSMENRIYIPIEDATLTFYAIFHKEDETFLNFLLSQADSIPWESFNAKEID